METSRHSPHITSLPREIINILYSMLTLEDAKSLGLTTKTFRELYLQNVALTEYITNDMYLLKNEPKIDISKFVQDILKHIRMGNRYIYLDMISNYEGTTIQEMHKIVNVTAPDSGRTDIILHVINNKYIKMISFSIQSNAIYERFVDDIATIKLITKSPFKLKMRPLSVYYDEMTMQLLKHDSQ
jgi:hypothetical protein